jgi:2-haloacid dehalogenase
MTKPVLAFDVYGTLIDTAGVASALRLMIGEQADEFASVWREKQLEYSFRRGLMRRYADFSVCVRDSLEFTARRLGVELGPAETASLLAAYRELPAFDDAATGLRALADGRFGLYAFSNGAAGTVDALLTGAGIRDFFDDVVSVEEVRSFKPDPAVYQHFLARADVTGDRAWLVSGNPFDVIGAMSSGMGGIWVRRSVEALFDPWGTEPTLTVSSLNEIAGRISEFVAGGA